MIIWGQNSPRYRNAIKKIIKRWNRPLEFHWSPFASSQPFVPPWHRRSVCRCCRTCRSCAGERSSSFRSTRGYEAPTRTSSNSQRSGSSAQIQLCSLELELENIIEVFVFISKDLFCWDWSRKQLSLLQFPSDNPRCWPRLRRSSHLVSLHSYYCTFDKRKRVKMWQNMVDFFVSGLCTVSVVPLRLGQFPQKILILLSEVIEQWLLYQSRLSILLCSGASSPPSDSSA